MAVVVSLHDRGRTAADERLTLADLLATAPLRAAEPEVLAGWDHLHTPIRWVHSGEVTDIGDLLRGGELLLTVGAGIGSRAAEQRRFVDRIAEQGGAGIVLELGTVFREVPDAVIARAREHDVPLVALRRPVPFVDVTEVAQRRILGDQAGAVRRADALHRELVALVLDGADTAALLDGLAHSFGSPLSIVRGDGSVLYHAAAGRHTSQDVLDAHAGAGMHGRAPALPIPSPSGGASLRLVLPCYEGSLADGDRVVLTRACDLLALSLLRRRQEDMLLARERGDFLSGLVEGELSEHEAETRATELGWPTSALMLPVVVAGRTPQQILVQRDTWSLVLRRVQQELDGHGLPVVAGFIERGHAVGAIIGVPGTRGASANPAEHRARIAGVAAEAFRMHAGRAFPGGGGIALCVGEAAARWAVAGVRLREVADLTPTTLQPGAVAWLDVARPSIDLLIQRLMGHDALETFVERRLASLERHDELRRSDLLWTLEVLFDHNGNKADTARALYLDRQSLYSRLRRIEELLGESLADERTRLGLQFALHARRLRAGSADA